jgi:hypothetical protein
MSGEILAVFRPESTVELVSREVILALAPRKFAALCRATSEERRNFPIIVVVSLKNCLE